ncbi:MAG TPA: DinB family protein [Tepidisphaeraceae bacterium]|jgi:uncharacterized damage-inducible protein DinB
MTSDPLEILLKHNQWANREMILACGRLTPEQFHRRFEMGPGSLHDTVTHILGSMRNWGDALAGREERARLENSQHTTDELLTLLDEISADLVHTIFAHPLDETFTRTRGGKVFTFTRGAVITHVTTHAMHHRAQCLNMLRQLGVAPLPPSGVVEWVRWVDAPQQ